MDTYYVTKEGHEKLKSDLEYLINVRRREIAGKLDHARSFGDLRENAEFKAAKEEQTLNETRVVELSQKLNAARIIDESSVPQGKVCLGSRVRLKDLKYDEEIEYMLVSDVEADFDQNKISVASPVGKGLLGARENETVEIKVPAGVLTYQILQVSR